MKAQTELDNITAVDDDQLTSTVPGDHISLPLIKCACNPHAAVHLSAKVMPQFPEGKILPLYLTEHTLHTLSEDWPRDSCTCTMHMRIVVDAIVASNSRYEH